MKVFLKDPEAMFPGERRMVNYHFTDKEIDDLIAFFEWAGQVDLNGFPADPPLGRVAGPAPSAAPGGASGSQAALPPQPAIYQALCTACHAIGGVGGVVGPALDTVHRRKSREELIVWLEDPAKVKPGTAMPKLPLTPEQIENIADYLTAIGGAP